MEIPDSFQQKYAFRFPASLTYFSHNVSLAVRASPVKGPVSILSGAVPAAVLRIFSTPISLSFRSNIANDQ
jgi:hypothetical protein